MTDSPSSGDLESALAAIQRRDPSGPIPRPAALTCEPVRSAHSNRRAALGLALVGLLVAGVIQLLTSTPDLLRSPTTDSRASVVFGNAQAGACLSWPADEPDRPSFVQCRDDHMFEVAKAVNMSNFGEPCQAAVRSYLGPRYDPDSRFTIGVLWAGDANGGQSNNRNLLCGLQLLGIDGEPTAFKGAVAELDQSKVWPPGTCLAIDPATNRSTDIPADCAKEHGMEVTGSVGLAERFPGGPPPQDEQDGFVREACTRITENYLAPTPLQATGLALNYRTLSADSWSAGSRQVSCGVVSPGEQGALLPLVGSVRSAPPGDQATPPPPVTSSEPPPPPETIPATTTTTTPEAATSSAPPSSAPPAPPAPSSTPTPTPPPPAELGPPPGPAPGEPLPTETAPPPGVILVPGLPPITLPGFAPPPPPPPPPPPVQ